MTKPQSAAPAIGETLTLKFVDSHGKSVDLAKLKGKVVLIDFWATWCGPCVAEVPNVVKTYNALHSKGFEIIGISLDSDKAALTKFTKEKGMPWPQYFDGKGWKNSMATKFGIHSVPTMWLVDKEGKLANTHARGGLEAEVEKLLAK
ncbi:MAG: TlpA family protein disulfide reductase [Verrucomicrobia bacterium]|nr:TlpA family protein disulfide reductase [Verrucomicrobiota bacterium]